MTFMLATRSSVVVKWSICARKFLNRRAARVRAGFVLLSPIIASVIATTDL